MISPIGICFIVLFVLIKISKRNTCQQFCCFFAITCALSINNLAGYFIRIASIEIGCVDIFLAICTLYALIISLNRKIKLKFSVSLVLLGIVFIGFVSGILLPANVMIRDYSSSNWDIVVLGGATLSLPQIGMQSFVMLIKLICFLITASFFKEIHSQSDLNNVKSIVNLSVRIHIVFVLFELISKSLLSYCGITDFIRESFLGGTNIFTGISYRGGLVALYGLTNEASHLAEVIFKYLCIVLICREFKHNIVFNLISVFILLLSMSFSAVMYAVCLILIYILRSQRPLNNIFALGAILIAVLIAFNALGLDYYFSRINGFVVDIQTIITNPDSIRFNEVTSSKVRLYGILKTFTAYLSRPLFGLGLGTAYCNSGLISLLSNIGLLGTIAWIVYMKSFLPSERVGTRAILLFIIVLLLPNILNGDMGMLYKIEEVLLISLVPCGCTRKVKKGVRNAKCGCAVKL